MHAITFALKRAHLSALAVGKRMLQVAVPEMTPARFDILYYLRTEALRYGPPLCWKIRGARRQHDIAPALGLEKSTISKMLRRLEGLGWVTRSPDYPDRRWKIVALTQAGYRAIGAAMRFIFRRRVMARPFDRIARVFHPTCSVSSALNAIWATVDGIARFMADDSTLWYDGGAPNQPLRHQRVPAIDAYLAELGYTFTHPSPPPEPIPKPAAPPHFEDMESWRQWTIAAVYAALGLTPSASTPVENDVENEHSNGAS